mgnify:CR=1 FL=1
MSKTFEENTTEYFELFLHDFSDFYSGFSGNKRSRASELLDSMNRTRYFMETRHLTDDERDEAEIALAYMEMDLRDSLREDDRHRHALDTHEDQLEAVQERLMGHRRMPRNFRQFC